MKLFWLLIRKRKGRGQVMLFFELTTVRQLADRGAVQGWKTEAAQTENKMEKELYNSRDRIHEQLPESGGIGRGQRDGAAQWLSRTMTAWLIVYLFNLLYKTALKQSDFYSKTFHGAAL